MPLNRLAGEQTRLRHNSDKHSRPRAYIPDHPLIVDKMQNIFSDFEVAIPWLKFRIAQITLTYFDTSLLYTCDAHIAHMCFGMKVGMYNDKVVWLFEEFFQVTICGVFRS